MTAFTSLALAILKGFVRDKASVFFAVIFPLMFLVLFGGILTADSQPRLDLEQVGAVPLVDGEPQQVTAERVDSGSVTWSPDGSTIAFLSARQPTDDSLYNDVFVVRPDGTELRQLTDTSLSIEQVLFSADGARLLLRAEDYSPDGTQWVGAQTGLFAVDAAAGGRPHRGAPAARCSFGARALHARRQPAW